MTITVNYKETDPNKLKFFLAKIKKAFYTHFNEVKDKDSQWQEWFLDNTLLKILYEHRLFRRQYDLFVWIK